MQSEQYKQFLRKSHDIVDCWIKDNKKIKSRFLQFYNHSEKIHKKYEKKHEKAMRKAVTEKKKNRKIVDDWLIAKDKGVTLSKYFTDLNKNGIEIEGTIHKFEVDEKRVKKYQKVMRKADAEKKKNQKKEDEEITFSELKIDISWLQGRNLGDPLEPKEVIPTDSYSWYKEPRGYGLTKREELIRDYVLLIIVHTGFIWKYRRGRGYICEDEEFNKACGGSEILRNQKWEDEISEAIREVEKDLREKGLLRDSQKKATSETNSTTENEILSIAMNQEKLNSLPDTPTGIVAVSLVDFMKEYCKDPPSDSALESKKNSLFKANRCNKIVLPESEGVWESGKTKRFDPEKLKKNWSKYRDYNSGLPLLKSPT